MTLNLSLVKVFISGSVIFMSGLLCVLIIILLRRALRFQRDRLHTLQIENAGNIPSVYYLKIESPEPALKFQLLINNVPLVNLPSLPEPALAPFAPPSTSLSISPNQPIQKNSSAINPGSALKAGRTTSSFFGTAASLLGSLGNLLPGQLGSSLRSNSAAAREAQSQTTQAVQTPVSAQRDLAGLQRQSELLTGGNTHGKAAAGVSGQPTMAVSAQNNGLDPQQSLRSSPNRLKHSAQTAYLAQTPEIQPGTLQNLTLRIGSRKWQYPKGSFLYTVWSEQVPVEALKIEIPVVCKDGTVHFEKPAIWQSWLFPLTSVLVISFAIMAVVFSLNRIW